MRAINVPAVDDENAVTVDATYKLGKKSVSESFDVIKSGSDWKLQRVVADLNLGGARYKGVPLKINGAKVSRDVVSVFPGSYALTSGRKTVSYGSKNTVLVRGPSDLPSTSGIKLSLTKSGTTSVKNAAERSYSKCLKQKKVAPKGCPFGLTTGSFKITTSTIKWTEKGADPFRKAKVSHGQHPGNGEDQDQRRDERRLHLERPGGHLLRRRQSGGGRVRVRGQAERQGDLGGFVAG